MIMTQENIPFTAPGDVQWPYGYWSTSTGPDSPYGFSATEEHNINTSVYDANDELIALKCGECGRCWDKNGQRTSFITLKAMSLGDHLSEESGS